MFPGFDFWWRAVFFSILPLCFYAVGGNVWRLNRNTERLHARLEPLERQRLHSNEVRWIPITTSRWYAVISCAVLSLIALFGPVLLPSFSAFGWRPTFVGALSVCFYSVASDVWRLNWNIERLHARLESLEPQPPHINVVRWLSLTGIWEPVISCAVLSLIALFGPVLLPSFGAFWWHFASLLAPAGGFQGVAANMWIMNWNMERLRERLEPLERQEPLG